MGYNELTDAMEERYQVAKNALLEAKSRCENAPAGNIHIVRNGKEGRRIQYYLRTNPGDKSGKYLKKGNEPLIEQLLQKEYDEKLIKSLEKELALLEKGLKCFKNNSISRIYEQMSEEKQKWIKPVCRSKTQIIEDWKSFLFESADYMEDKNIYVTKNKERVRSKSELIIANMLAEREILYRYECPLQDANGIWVIPDFTVLNKRTGRVYYWEHFGMMEDPNYARNAIRKIAKYEEHGLYQGDKLISSFESLSNPLDLKQLEGLISYYFE